MQSSSRDWIFNPALVGASPTNSSSGSWCNSSIFACEANGPGATPGSRTNSLQAARQHAAESPKLSSLRAARRQPAIFILGSWQTSNALALQASLCGSVTHRLHQFQLRETRPMHREKPHKLLQVGVTPTPATNFQGSDPAARL